MLYFEKMSGVHFKVFVSHSMFNNKIFKLLGQFNYFIGESAQTYTSITECEYPYKFFGIDFHHII